MLPSGAKQALVKPFKWYCGLKAEENFAFWVTIITALLAAETGLQVWTAIESERAWIAPRGAEIVSKVERGETLEIEIIYQNIGKRPAFDVIHRQQIGTMPVPLDLRGTAYWERMPLPLNTTCDTALAEAERGIGGTAFGNQDYRDIAYIFTSHPGGVPDKFLERKITVFAQGCFAFRSLWVYRISPYCFYIYPAKGAAVQDWKFKFCPPLSNTP